MFGFFVFQRFQLIVFSRTNDLKKNALSVVEEVCLYN